MGPRDTSHELTPVLRVGLKRIDLEERVLGDDELRCCPLARLVGEEILRILLAEASGRRFAHGARIFLEADPGHSLFLVLKGEVRLTVGTGAETVDVAIVRKGELMGEWEAAGESSRRSYTATAVGEIELVEFPRAAVRILAHERASVAKHLKDLGEERKATGAQMADFVSRW